MKRFLIFAALSVALSSGEAGNYPELRECWEKGNESCGLQLAKELVKDEKTEEEGMNIFLDLALRGNTWAPRYVGTGFIYPRGPMMKKMRDCKKGIFFLMAGSKKDPDTLKELALLFKRGVCVKKDMAKYKKYMDIYRKELKKLEREPKFEGIPGQESKELYPDKFVTFSEEK